jgi:hypothetical protein
MGLSTNSEIGELFEINYSWVSRRAETMKVHIDEDRALRKSGVDINSRILFCGKF